MCNNKINLLVSSLLITSLYVSACGNDEPKYTVSDDNADDTQVIYEMDNSTEETCESGLYNSSSECLSQEEVENIINSCRAIVTDGYLNRMSINKTYRSSTSNYDPETEINDGAGKNATLYTFCQNALRYNEQYTNNNNNVNNGNYPYQNANRWNQNSNGWNQNSNRWNQDSNFNTNRPGYNHMNGQNDVDQNRFHRPYQRFSTDNESVDSNWIQQLENLSPWNPRLNSRNTQDWRSMLSQLKGAFTDLKDRINSRRQNR